MIILNGVELSGPQLGRARRVAREHYQSIGKEFPIDEKDVDAAAQALIDAGIVYREGDGPIRRRGAADVGEAEAVVEATPVAEPAAPAPTGVFSVGAARRQVRDAVREAVTRLMEPALAAALAEVAQDVDAALGDELTHVEALAATAAEHAAAASSPLVRAIRCRTLAHLAVRHRALLRALGVADVDELTSQLFDALVEAAMAAAADRPS